MEIWTYGKREHIEIGQRVFIGRCGSWGRNVYGEFGRLERVTARHAVFVSDSGSVVKTAIDNMNLVAGGFNGRYWVSLRIDRAEGKDYMQERPNYWNGKKLELCYR